MSATEFGKKLSEIRKAKGLTQEEVAEMCNITVRTIQRIESGNVQPRAFTIKLLSEALGFNFFECADTGNDLTKTATDSNSKGKTILWYVKDLFNFKTNVMKKVSILATSFLIMGFALFTVLSETNAQSSEAKITRRKAPSITSSGGYSNISKDSKKRPNYIVTKDSIEVAFTNAFTLDSLVFVRNSLASRGLAVNYKSLTFDKRNRLESIDCEVIADNGNKVGFTINSLSSINKHSRFGFKRDFTGRKGVPVLQSGSLR